MKLLAIETATEGCSAALWCEGEILHREQEAPRAHGRLILPMMQAVLDEAGVDLGAVDALAFGRGPGAFTGLRMACAVIQGVAFARDLPVVPVSTLASLAQRALDQAPELPVMAALDARMGEVYWAMYGADVEGLAMLGSLPEQVSAPDQLADQSGQAYQAIGRGWQTYGAVLAASMGQEPQNLAANLLPRAHEVARLAVRDFAQGLGVSADEAMPVYLRDQVVKTR
ncbi:tRNA threonylcarbamoyladenosine biosynthesis protein TsaB [Ectothiorhodosinus mongolicus]|uniref:tRNA threonylcarbamoyladenosine biosynthesis protein TsaB n=1 Tax=Ectothiorhodosinus mongolicus TaxID=233100 RepID=A0A1R3VMQ1_9GAMM|nr:tRNA (adenosine(37)-N6)-threonylcarbamoyltransferase complex dimerization subunit type 1 TsaB [Ectothiorhodosinus mongolicus]ULX57863.1 tRNA (adenosine(37)-N6)-threonylcarbamoyltransferase complex dimerization subunit type 1 TsaB [Ectothiorhodosinus mongolicus]SIT65817.1 tRNA threonylcarbamoyladenosine biosynthesis protein TsaB [Ectothiorhodosinus mongolicus]